MISTRTNSMDYSPHSDYAFSLGWYIAVSTNVCKTHTQNARENRARKNRKKKSRPPLARLWPCRPLEFGCLALQRRSRPREQLFGRPLRSLASCCALVLNRARVHTSRTHKNLGRHWLGYGRAYPVRLGLFGLFWLIFSRRTVFFSHTNSANSHGL